MLEGFMLNKGLFEVPVHELEIVKLKRWCMLL